MSEAGLRLGCLRAEFHVNCSDPEDDQGKNQHILC
jgi:hypothetical protein